MLRERKNDQHHRAGFGFAEVCAALSDRFGTRFKLENTGGNCVTLVAKLESGIELLITDCENTLVPRPVAPRWPRRWLLRRRVSRRTGYRRGVRRHA
jgi:hypothetical protein